MSDEKNQNNVPEEEAIDNEVTSGATAEDNTQNTDSDAELQNELENLRDTFQQAYNEEASAAEMPAIQELDTTEEPEEPVVAEPEKTESAPYGISVTKKPKKKIKKKTVICAIANLLILVLIIAPLGTYFAASLSQPDISDLFSSMIKASAADNAADSLSYYKTALTYCDEDGSFASLRQDILENIVLATASSASYSEAKSYMDENMTEEMIASPKTAEFKEFLQVEGKISEVADKAYDEVKKELDALDKDKQFDATAAAKAIDAPNAVVTEVASALTDLSKALTVQQTASSQDEVEDYLSSFLSCYSAFKGLGADCQQLLEKIAVAVYNSGYAYEAQLITKNYMTEEMLASPKTEEFKAMNTELEAAASFKDDVYTLAAQLQADGHKKDEDFASFVTGSMTDSIKKSIANIIGTLIDAINYENDKNLTKASALYTQALNSASSLGIKPELTALKAAKTLFTLGDTASAADTIKNFISEEYISDASEADRALYADINAANAAQQAADDVFYPYYMAYSNSGTAIDKAKVTAELDALITASSTSFDKAYVSFYKYYTENFTDADKATMHSYLLDCQKLLPDFPFFYGYSLIESYRVNSEYTNAISLAKQLLEINSADDFANSVLALSYRMQNNIDMALKTALYGIDNSGTTCYSGYEAAVAYTLKGDYKNAMSIIETLFDSALTINVCNLTKLVDALYDGADTDLEATISEYSKQVDSLFSNYGYSVSADVAAVTSGAKTVSDIFTTGTYDFA